MTLSALGASLRAAGLSPRALAAWAGSDRLSALPFVVPARPRAGTAASAALELFVAGDEVAAERVKRLDVAGLAAAGLVEVAGTAVRARVAVLPLGQALLVCDRLDAAPEPELVCWPDDSSYHLALAPPPGGRARWIDLGCGSAFAPLARPGLARAIAGTDLNPRAVHHAELGAALSGIAHLRVVAGDLAEPVPADARPADLVTCNAPIPGDAGAAGRPMWRATGADFVARALAAAGTLVAPGGMVVVHAALDALAPVIAGLPGERVVLAYTPQGEPAFAVAWWRPDGEARHVAAHRELTATHPHLTHADREAAIAT